MSSTQSAICLEQKLSHSEEPEAQVSSWTELWNAVFTAVALGSELRMLSVDENRICLEVAHTGMEKRLRYVDISSIIQSNQHISSARVAYIRALSASTMDWGSGKTHHEVLDSLFPANWNSELLSNTMSAEHAIEIALVYASLPNSTVRFKPAEQDFLHEMIEDWESIERKYSKLVAMDLEALDEKTLRILGESYYVEDSIAL